MNKNKNNIILIGFMGTGKTTLSKKLEESCGFTRYSVDELIIKEAKMSINDIFAKYGEKHFRELESNMITKLVELMNGTQSNIVIDCGGGIINAANFNDFKTTGTVVLLDADINNISERLKDDDTRPLAKDKTKFYDLYNSRKEKYESLCDVKLCISNLQELDNIVDDICKKSFKPII